jgi:hypothetical protein
MVSLTKLDEDSDYTTRAAAIARQQKLAEALSKMGEQEQAVYTAGGITAPVSGMGALARGLTSFGGSYLAGKASADEAALKKSEKADAISQLSALYKLPDTTGLVMSNADAGKTKTPITAPAFTIPGSDISNAAVTSYGMMPNIPRTEVGTIPGAARPYAEQQQMLNQWALGDNKNLAALAPVIAAQLKPEYFAGSEYGNYSRDAAGNITQIRPPAPIKSTAPSAIQEAEWFRTATPEQKTAYNAAKAAGRPVTNIVMPKPANAFATEFGSGLAKSAMATIDIGKKAPAVIQSANRVIDALTNPKNAPMTGTFAAAQLMASKAYYGDTASAASTEGLMSDLASSTLDAIQTSGLGTGQGFTNKDKDYLEMAKAGKIANTKENLVRLANLRKSTATAAVAAANDVMGKVSTMPEYAGLKSLLQPIQANIPEYVTDPVTGQIVLKKN